VYKKYLYEDLVKIFDLHSKYLTGEEGGVRAELSGGDFYGTDFSNLAGANLEATSFKRSNIMGINLEGANLKAANMKRACFASANLQKANMEGAFLKGCNFDDADLRGTNLKGASMEDAYFGNAKYDNETIWPDDFDPVAVGATLIHDE